MKEIYVSIEKFAELDPRDLLYFFQNGDVLSAEQVAIEGHYEVETNHELMTIVMIDYQILKKVDRRKKVQKYEKREMKIFRAVDFSCANITVQKR